MRRLIALTRGMRYRINALTYKAFGKKDEIRRLERIVKGEPLLIVGNGPSLNDTPLDDFRNITSIGMNKIDMIYGRVEWRPDLVICTNNLVVKQHAENFSESDIPIYLSWKSRWFMPRGGRNVRYFLNKKTKRFERDAVDGLGSGATVTYTALQLAYYMGADPVILVGVDHSFSVNGKPNEVEKRRGQDSNHFDAGYFKEGTYWGVPDLAASEADYARARVAFEEDGRNIYDATINGQLNIFEKIPIETARKFIEK